MSSNKKNDAVNIRRELLQEFFVLLIFSFAGLGIAWYLFDKIYLYYGAKYTVVDLATDITRLVIGIVVLFGVLVATKWDNVKYPYLPTQ